MPWRVVIPGKVILIWLSAITLVLLLIVTKISFAGSQPHSVIPQLDTPTTPDQRRHTQQALLPQVPATPEFDSVEAVRNRTLGFEKILVLNLPSRTDYRDALDLAAGFTGLDLTFVDGVQGDTIQEKAQPFTEGKPRTLSASELGCWRAHVNAYEIVVEQNLGSALIMEGDADWDIRIKEQVSRFALASQALTQPLAGNDTDHYVDPTFGDPGNSNELGQAPLRLDSLPKTQAPDLSPFGDDWDVLWLGHCAQHVPALADYNDAKQLAEASRLPLGHVIFEDETAPQPQHRHTFNDKDIFPFKQYPGLDYIGTHTRVVHHSMDGMCNTAYAVSQRGARKLLFETGIEARQEPLDFMVQRFCGSDPISTTADFERNPDKAKDLGQQQRNICLTVQPPLFAQVKMKGTGARQSDIKKGFLGGMFRWAKALEESKTKNIRQSVRLNLKKLVRGEGDLVDQYPDEDKAPWL